MGGAGIKARRLDPRLDFRGRTGGKRRELRLRGWSEEFDGNTAGKR